jgi:DNA-binding beta-propeller fold protein YncE
MGRWISHLRVEVCLLALLAMGAILPASAIAQAPAYITQWGTFGAGNGQFHDPFFIVTDTEGNVYVSDTGNNRIQKFTSGGDYLTQWGSFGSGSGQFMGPEGVATDAAGNVYVADHNNQRIQKFSSTGTYLTEWDDPSGRGLFYPTALAIGATGMIFVSTPFDEFPGIFRLSSTGILLNVWYTPGFYGVPEALVTDAAGSLYASGGGNIVKFTSDGAPLILCGSFGSGDGQFFGVSGIAIDADNNVYASDVSNNRIQEFTSDGNYLTQWGSLGSGDGQFVNPRGIAIDPAGNIYVVDSVNQRVEKFGSLPTPTKATSWARLKRLYR